MSKNVFDKIQDVTTNVSKNTFDWSHANNFTAQIGKIVPIFCEQLPAGSSIKVNPTFALKFMPMMFPIQTRMKAYLSFFRVPLRALWSDYADFISSPNSDSTLVAPYLSNNKNGNDLDVKFNKGNILGIGGISDYLGVPVSYTMNAAENCIVETANDPALKVLSGLVTKGGTLTMAAPSSLDIGKDYCVKVASLNAPAPAEKQNDLELVRVVVNLDFGSAFAQSVITGYKSYFSRVCCFSSTYSLNATSVTVLRRQQLILDDDHFIVNELENGRRSLQMIFDVPVPRYGAVWFSVPGNNAIINSQNYTLKGTTQENLFSTLPVTSAQMTADTCPYYGFTGNAANNDKAIKLSVYPYRAYEAIYNGYMRNIRNNPFLVNGKPVYNRFIPVNTGGPDTYNYELYSANWASDAFTTAVPSPQQGTQPLVGLTTYTEQIPQGSTTATVLKTALVDEEGNKYKVSYQSNGSALTGVTYEKLSDDTAVSPVSSLYNLLQSGISINDFRNVNAYQRYLEMNMFKGYSYRQIVEGRFDCTVHYDTLLLPEYLGGITRDVTINPVTQMIEVNGNGTYNGALGSQAGNGTCFGNSEHTIKGFCDEESIVMGLLTVVPMPVYTQPIPKFFLYRDRLDTFNPEFDHIGYQPIYTKELCPVNQWLEDKTKMNTVFGYQRPWYEYVQKRDTAHGLFRTELRNFIMNRVFSGVPELGQDFTTVDPAQVNDVFSVTEVSDKILGQVYFDCTVKLPISRVVVPRLE